MRQRHGMIVLIAAMCAALHVDGGHAQQTAQRGMTYDSLKDLPAFAGMWGPAPGGRGGAPGARGAAQPARQGGPPNAEQLLTDLPPLRNQQVLARYKEAMMLLVSGVDNVELQAKYGDVLQGRGGGGSVWRELGSGLCDPYGGAGIFSGRTGGGPETVMEVFFTPGRVIITTDHGVLRRIYTDGRPIPRDAFPTVTGTSIGHWEGNVLVIDTVGLSPKTTIAGVPFGEGFTIRERLYLDDRDVLHLDGTITAPEALTGPYSYAQTYGRFQNAGYTPGQFVTECDKDDRSIDKANSRQRFDLTPPKDLPPPPSN